MGRKTENKQKPSRPLPGDAPLSSVIERMIRVDQAGEYGAVRIYSGQLAVLGPDHALDSEIAHMQKQEQVHLNTFNDLVADRGVRPTLLEPLWNMAGFALGAATALMGEKAAMACTVAVEEVIDAHYQDQIKRLEAWQVEPELKATVSDFRADELEHREMAINHGAEQTPGYAVLSSVIKSGCRAAIWLSKRI